MKKILLDENLPVKLKTYFSEDVEIFTVPDLGWQSKKNGELLEAMSEKGLDILLTVDRGLRHQQNLEKYGFLVAVLLTYDNRLKTLISKIEQVESEIKKFQTVEKFLEIDLRDKQPD